MNFLDALTMQTAYLNQFRTMHSKAHVQNAVLSCIGAYLVYIRTTGTMADVELAVKHIEELMDGARAGLHKMEETKK